MEFYFSDANLHKDRFLKKLMDESEEKCKYMWHSKPKIYLKTLIIIFYCPFYSFQGIPLEIFLKFNKLKSITTNLQLIAKALKKSELIEVIILFLCMLYLELVMTS